MFRRMNRSAAVAAALALAVLAAPLGGIGAQAFTFNDQPSGNSGASTRFADPAERAKSRMSGDSSDRSTVRNGNTTLQFGSRGSFDQRNNGDRYFSPNNLMGR